MKLLMLTLLVAYAAAVINQESTESPTLLNSQSESENAVVIPSYPANAQSLLSEADKNSQTLPVSKGIKEDYDYVTGFEPRKK